MNTVNTHTIGIFLPTFKERVAEICKEKNIDFSVRSLAAKANINREVFRKMINGEKTATLGDVKELAMALDITPERLLQEDIRPYVDELESLLKSPVSAGQALELSEKIREVAIGVTERFHANYYLGRAYFDLRRYQEAQNVWVEALKDARELDSKTTINQVLMKLMVAYTKTRETFDGIDGIDELIEYFELKSDTPQKLAQLYYAKAAQHEKDNKLDEALRNMNLALEQRKKAGDVASIGVEEHNVAHFEYKLGNYEAAKSYLESAIDKTKALDASTRGRVYKDLGKTLIKLHEFESASKYVKEALEFPNLDSEVCVKLKIVLAEAEDDHTLALDALHIQGIDNTTTELVYEYLLDYFNRKDMPVEFLTYYRKRFQLCNGNSDVFVKEVF